MAGSGKDQTSSTFMLEGKYLDLLQSGTLSDAQVRCGKRTWKVHKVILYVRSEWFKKALTGPFKEAETGVVTITGFTEEEVDCLLHYIYTGKLKINDNLPEEATLSTNISIWRLGDFFCLKDLCAIALDKYRRALRLLSWWLSSKTSSDSLRRQQTRQMIQLIQTLYKQKGARIPKALASPLFALILANIQVLGKNEEFTKLLVHLPEFASDWAVAFTKTMSSSLRPEDHCLNGSNRRFFGRCNECNLMSDRCTSRHAPKRGEMVQLLCGYCFSAQQLVEWTRGSSSDNEQRQQRQQREQLMSWKQAQRSTFHL
ncbi:hypothetical protein diail_5713 [Diaporthe ilicicola]|nr:hypothetical protein diail_5713 [Diaporthe ilicicola]